MANFGEIKKLINALINTNGRQAITGKVMNATLVKMMDSVETAISEKVDKETGKGLSSNDYTEEDREKLASLENYDDSEVKETLSTLVKADTELAGAIGKKVDKVEGKQLTTEDFTTALKEKLQGLNNYDDTEVKSAIEKLRGDFDTLVAGDTTAAIKSFNDIVAFLEGIEDSESLDSIIASIEQQIAGKQDVISDLNTIRQGAAKGATALQSVPDDYAKKTDVVDAISNKVDKEVGKGLSSNDYTDGEKAKVENALKRMTPVTYANLVALRNAGNLIAGMKYRITDYMTTTSQADTQSAGHQFDLVVTALDSSTLSEEVSAIVHDGDTYFTDAGANLSAWKIWYCLDNDTSRFAWADSENGKGVIYRMIDDNNNDCSFDFKNIMFLRYDKKFYYTLCVSRSDCDKDNSFNVSNNQIMSFYCMVINSNNCKVGKHCSATIDIERSENIVISNSCYECYISDSTNMYIGTESERIEVYDCRDFSIGNHVGGVIAYDSIDCYVGDYAHNISFEASVSCKALFGVYEAYFFEKQLVTCNEKVYFFDIEKGDVKLDFNVHDLGDDFLNLHIIVENFCGPLSFMTEEYGEFDYEVNVYRGDKWLGSAYGECLFDSNESMRNFENDSVPIEDILLEDLIVGETLKVTWSLLDTSSNPIVTYEQDVVYN